MKRRMVVSFLISLPVGAGLGGLPLPLMRVELSLLVGLGIGLVAASWGGGSE